MRKKRSGKAFLWTLVFVMLPVLALLGLDFASKQGHPTLDVSVEDLVLEDCRFSMTASQGGNSGTAFRRASWEIEDGTLYLTLFHGLARDGFRQDKLTVEIEDSALEGVRQVVLRDRSATKLLYAR